jgi:hypothetical protein
MVLGAVTGRARFALRCEGVNANARIRHAGGRDERLGHPQFRSRNDEDVPSRADHHATDAPDRAPPGTTPARRPAARLIADRSKGSPGIAAKRRAGQP